MFTLNANQKSWRGNKGIFRKDSLELFISVDRRLLS